MKAQCDHCKSDVTVLKGGLLRKHPCRRFDHEAAKTVFGDRDVHNRKN